MMRKVLFLMLAMAVLAQIVHGHGGCKKEKKAATQKAKSDPSVYIPRCEKNGDYKMAQCNAAKGECFCVDPKTGKQKGEAKKGGIKCSG